VLPPSRYILVLAEGGEETTPNPSAPSHTRRLTGHWFALVLAICGTYGAWAAQPDSQASTTETDSHVATAPALHKIMPNFVDADIERIAQAVALATHKAFVIDARVRFEVTMLSETPMTPDAFYQRFLVMLHAHGFVTVRVGKLIEIMPASDIP